MGHNSILAVRREIAVGKVFVAVRVDYRTIGDFVHEELSSTVESHHVLPIG